MRDAPRLAIAFNMKISPIMSPMQPESKRAAQDDLVGGSQILKQRMVMIKAARATKALKVFIQKGLIFRANSAKMVLAYEKHSVALNAR